jgi:hypothetical protein
MCDRIETLCKDCRTYPICLTKNHAHDCPCPVCLVKVMCGKSCVAYSKFFNNSIGSFQITEEKHVHKR